MVKEKDDPSILSKDEIGGLKELTLFNDDVNSFDFVIECLIEICHHNHEQAEQCTLIAHFKGKCTIKTGGFSELKPLLNELQGRGLTVAIE